VTAKTWYLLPRATAALEDIGAWTKDRFGERQADQYLEALIDRCSALADGTAQNRSCRDLVDGDVPEDYRFTRAGQHYVVFVETDAEVAVVDFVHQRMDLAGSMRETKS
jgi:toxin ParE1/3/4